MQQEVVTVNQGDKVIREKCGDVYTLKEGNSVKSRVSMTSLKESSSRGAASRKIAMERELSQSVAGKRKCAFGQSSRWPKA